MIQEESQVAVVSQNPKENGVLKDRGGEKRQRGFFFLLRLQEIPKDDRCIKCHRCHQGHGEDGLDDMVVQASLERREPVCYRQ